MKEIAAAIAEGARAFLTAEYKILIIFVAVLFVLIGIGIGNWVTAICFVVGALFSTVAGYCGMTVATKANVRTANAAKESGMNKALSIAFSGGAVMGMCVAGLGALGVSLVYIVTRNVDVLFGFSLGASSIALFARVGGGIYTKAADVGADLVGKVEAGIPEDDPRNPAVIADNVGDNVGDVAGMGADLFESYCGSLISALTLGVAVSEVSGVLFPLAIAGCGLIASMIGTFFVRGGENANPQKALTKGSYAASVLVMIASLALSRTLFGNMNAAIAVIAGLIVGVIMVYSASSGLGYLIAKGFFDTVPRALCEAARIDGCSEARIFFQMVLPMSRPIVVYTVISSFLVPWMDFVYAKMILNAGISSKYTVAIGLYKMLDKSLINSYFTQFCAGGVLVSVPISILFMIMQKFYVEGITGGAVKG